jgi:hypothetical protein
LHPLCAKYGTAPSRNRAACAPHRSCEQQIFTRCLVHHLQAHVQQSWCHPLLQSHKRVVFVCVCHVVIPFVADISIEHLIRSDPLASLVCAILYIALIPTGILLH